jgi:hypothetical protein
MVDPISTIRQMMAESKFLEALALAQAQLSSQDVKLRTMLLPLYLELLEGLDRKLPIEILIEAAELLFNSDIDSAIKLIEYIPEADPNFLRIQLLKIRVAESKGRLEALYSLISELKLRLFTDRIPLKIDLVEAMVQKYFKDDFHLRLQELSLLVMLCDLPSAESVVQELIYSCVEKASPRGTREKLLSIAEIIGTQKEKKQLEIYQSFCRISAEGIKEKAEYKKIAEMLIYFDDFKFQLLILDLLEKLGLTEAAADYAVDVRSNKKYNFVYVEKYFIHLKKHFNRTVRQKVEETKEETVEHTLEGAAPAHEFEDGPVPSYMEEESILVSTLKYQNYSPPELMELATGFLQSSYPRAALEALCLAGNQELDERTFLKISYLRAICLCQLTDHRAVIDLALEALGRAQVQEDILSFLYLQAEAEQKLGLIKDARRTLKTILSIDSQYRLTRERLARLDEI